MSAGSANRVDSSKIEVASIWKTHGNRLARKIRSELRKVGFNKNFKVVFSSEPDISSKGGSFVGVTGAFGLVICSGVHKRDYFKGLKKVSRKIFPFGWIILSNSSQ